VVVQVPAPAVASTPFTVTVTLAVVLPPVPVAVSVYVVVSVGVTDTVVAPELTVTAAAVPVTWPTPLIAVVVAPVTDHVNASLPPVLTALLAAVNVAIVGAVTGVVVVVVFDGPPPQPVTSIENATNSATVVPPWVKQFEMSLRISALVLIIEISSPSNLQIDMRKLPKMAFAQSPINQNAQR
jgi:hypothetical protein